MRTPQLADNLRRAVLQAAIEGKLNDRTNENARDLLAQIQAEKTARIKQGGLKKSKPLAAISEEEILFAIPENWVWVRLGEIGIWGSGATPNRSNPDFYRNGDINWLKTGDLNDGYINETSEKITALAVEKSSVTLQPVGAVLIAMYGATIGKLGILNIPATTNQACCACVPFKGVLNKYLFYFLLFNRSNFILMGAGGAQPNISKEKIVSTLIPLPPLTEQQQIVAKLNHLLTEIDELKTQEQALLATQNAFPKKLRAALLQAAVQGELNERTDENARDLLAAIQTEKAALQKAGKLKKDKPLAAISEEEIPFAIPENWVWVRLGNITDYGIGKQIPPEKIPIGALVIEMEDIEKDTYCLLEKHRERTPKSSKNGFFAGDVLYGKLRPYLKKIVVANEDGFCSTEIIPFNGFGKINPQYLLFCMTSPFMLSNVNQLTYGMDMPRLGTNDARNLPIPLPPLTEQQQIVAKLEALMAEIDTLENAA